MRNKLLMQMGIFGMMGCAVLLAARPGVLPDSSLYQLSSIWTTDSGKKIHLADLQGKVRLFTFFFGHCQSSCPMVIGRMKSLETQLPEDWGNQAGFVLVTMDPRRDDSGGLADYRRDLSLRTDRWTLLRGNLEDTRELAMLLGISYAPSDKNGGIEHSVAMVLLNREGKIIRSDVNLDDAAAQLAALRSALADSETAKQSGLQH